jgi:hypothetical protein
VATPTKAVTPAILLVPGENSNKLYVPTIVSSDTVGNNHIICLATSSQPTVIDLEIKGYLSLSASPTASVSSSVATDNKFIGSNSGGNPTTATQCITIATIDKLDQDRATIRLRVKDTSGNVLWASIDQKASSIISFAVKDTGDVSNNSEAKKKYSLLPLYIGGGTTLLLSAAAAAFLYIRKRRSALMYSESSSYDKDISDTVIPEEITQSTSNEEQK